MYLCCAGEEKSREQREAEREEAREEAAMRKREAEGGLKRRHAAEPNTRKETENWTAKVRDGRTPGCCESLGGQGRAKTAPSLFRHKLDMHMNICT